MSLIVGGSNEIMRKEESGKLFKLHMQRGFFLVYSLMIKCSSFSPKLLNDFPLQFSSEEYVEKHMASFPIFTFETTIRIGCANVHIP